MRQYVYFSTHSQAQKYTLQKLLLDIASDIHAPAPHTHGMSESDKCLVKHTTPSSSCRGPASCHPPCARRRTTRTFGTRPIPPQWAVALAAAYSGRYCFIFATYLRDASSRATKVYPHASGRRRGAGALVRTPGDNKTSSPSYRLEVASRRRVSDGGRSVSGALECLEQSVRQAPPRAAPGGSQWTCRPAATFRDPTSAHSCGQRSTEYAGEP